MKKAPKISVIIPTHNEERYIGRCLSSLKKQTFIDFEVIVIDNNCTDKTAEIAKRLGASVVIEKKQGLTPAREKGFLSAKADIIARTDADTIVAENWLEKIFYAFSENPKLVALTGGFSFSENKLVNQIIRFMFENLYVKLTKTITGHYTLNGPNYAVKRQYWQKANVHLDDKLVHEDIDLSCHLASFGEIAYYPDLTVVFSMRRWKKRPFYTLFEYTKRYIRTILLHHFRPTKR